LPRGLPGLLPIRADLDIPLKTPNNRLAESPDVAR
jgi:hypothetical protein